MKSFLYPVLLAALPSLASAEIILRKGGLMVDSSLVQGSSAVKQLSAPDPDPAGNDLILFENGDLMHGNFAGINEGLIWERNDIERPIKFGIPSVRQVVFKGASGVVLKKETSFVTLVNGDSIPGEIVSLDDKFLTIKSSIVGDVKIPRAHIKSLTPNPFDGELYYSGPYTSDGWMVLDNRQSEEEIKKEAAEAEEEAAEAAADPKAEEAEEQEAIKEEKKSSAWIHSGAAFYSIDRSPLVLPDADIPDVGRIKFKVEWKGRLSLIVALHSDFTRVLPALKKEKEKAEKEEKEEKEEEAEADEKAEKAPEEEPEEEGDLKEPPAPLRTEKLVDLRQGKGFQSIPWVEPLKRTHADMFGTGYTMTLQSSYPNISRNYFSETGVARTQQMSSVRSNISLSEGEEADIEIRYNRKESLLVLFINGNYAAQWNDMAGFPGDGTGFGIVNNATNAQVRVSEVMITSWNGMTDSAKSMANAERDLVLLANGTDRFSGQISHIADGIAHLKSDYLNAKIPVTDLSKVILKTSTATDLEADDLSDDLNWKSDPVTVIYKPFGKIRIDPTSATNEHLTGTSPFLGKITVDLSTAALLRFTQGSPDLSDWFDDF
ncbi:MAG: hypothetical protein ACJAVK_002895 [Akkermansiaceae bacterium]|jgi:hypothetical protein